jgi:hypothetical protein
MNACPDLLAALRQRERDLELDACSVRARVEEVRELIALLENGPRRKSGRPRRPTVIEMPERVDGTAGEPDDAA